MRLAVIPARGGSKRIPQKNIKNFCGKPAICWSIEAALNSNFFDRIIVSTDSEEIAKVALKAGAEVPFFRPAELSGDYVGTIPVVSHAISWATEREGMGLSSLCCIYPAAPFVTPKILIDTFRILENSDCEYVFPVVRYPFPIQRAVEITEKNRVKMVNPELFNVRSQDFPEMFHDAGQFYWGRPEAWLRGASFFTENSIPFPIPRYLAEDIDTAEDWIIAEALFTSMLRK